MVAKQIADKRIKDTEDRLHRDHDRQVEVFDRQLNSELRARQNDYKWGALLLPPILPFIVAAFVFFNRRAQEREGVAKSRLR
jgi:ABC-2 type transport system permease protein